MPRTRDKDLRYRILSVLVEAESSPISTRAIAERADCSNKTVSDHVRIMSKAGMLKIFKNGNGRGAGKASAYRVSDRGRKALANFKQSQSTGQKPAARKKKKTLTSQKVTQSPPTSTRRLTGQITPEDLSRALEKAITALRESLAESLSRKS